MYSFRKFYILNLKFIEIQVKEISYQLKIQVNELSWVNRRVQVQFGSVYYITELNRAGFSSDSVLNWFYSVYRYD